MARDINEGMDKATAFAGEDDFSGARQEAYSNLDEKGLRQNDSNSRGVTAEFGKIEIQDRVLPGAGRAQETHPPEKKESKTVDIQKQADGGWAYIDPKEGDHQTTRFFDHTPNNGEKPDRKETVYDAGQADHKAKVTEYTDPSKHGGKEKITTFDRNDEGKKDETQYQIKHAHKGEMEKVTNYDSDNSKDGIKKETKYDADTTKPTSTKTEREYDPSKHDGVAREKELVNGKVLRYDQDNKLIPEKKAEAAKPAEKELPKVEIDFDN